MPELCYQAFLSHNAADKPAVEELGRRLEREGIACWLDKWNIIPGEAWRPALEHGIAKSETCLVFVGPSGFSPWHTQEMDLAIREGVERKPRPLRVLPVLLPGGKAVANAELPGFLKGIAWVQFTQSLDEPESFRRLVCGILGKAPGAAAEQAPFVGQCPYVGLRPFRAEEAPFFFGREGTVRQLLARLGNWFGTRDERRLLAVLGPSGSGKSSMVAAGLLPVLRRGGLPGSEQWLYVSCKPGPNPWESLQVALGSDPEIRPHLPAISEQIARTRDESARLHLAGRYALNRPDDPRRLAIFVDQFEEVFTYAKRPSGQPSLEAADADGLGPERRLFIENLLRAIREEQGRVIVVLALRADFYGHCALLPALRTAVSDNQVLLGPMSRDELRDSIVCPAQRCSVEVEPALVERLLEDMERQPGALPFLQHTLEQLWKVRDGRRLTLAAYDTMGSLEGAVDRYAEAYYKNLSPDRQKLLRRILLDLVQLGEGAADTKRRRALRDLPGGKSDDLHLFIKDLADRNLVTTSRLLEENSAAGPSDDVEVELSHEALLRGWKSFQHWIDSSRDHLRLKDRIEEAAKQWKRHPDDDYLWRGGQLAGVEDALSKADVTLSGESEAFLGACRTLHHRLRAETEAQARERERSRFRFKRLALFSSGLAFVAVVGSGLAGGFLAKSHLEKARADKAADGLKNKLSEASQSDLTLAQRLINDAHLDGAKIAESYAYLARSLRFDSNNLAALRAVPLHLLNSPIPRQLSLPFQHESRVFSAVFSPDGTRILTASDDNTARLWDAGSGQPIGPKLQHEGPVDSAVFSPDGTRILTASYDKTARLWNAGSGQPIGPKLQHGNTVHSAVFSPDGTRILTASADTVRLWDAGSGQPIGLKLQHGDTVNSAVFGPDGTRILTASTDNRARLWDAGSGQPIGPKLQHEGPVNSAVFSPDGTRILTASWDNTVRLWDAGSGQPIGPKLQHGNTVYSAVFSPDGTRILTASADTVRLWDAGSGQPIGLKLQHGDTVHSAVFSPDGTRILTVSADKTARLWDASSGQPIGPKLQHDKMVTSAVFSPDGTRILTASEDKTARLWDAGSGQPIGPKLQHGNTVHSAVFSPDGTRILTASFDSTARLWDASSGQPFSLKLQHEGPVNSAVFSPDGTRILTASWDNTARLWDAGSGHPIGLKLQHEGPVDRAVFSPDGTRILTASYDKTARLWNAGSGQPIGPKLQHEGGVNSAVFSPDGRRILTASHNSTARLWDASSGQPFGLKLQHEGPVNSAVFSPDGARILTASWDNTARLWDAGSGHPIGLKLQHEGPVDSAVFSPDGTRILTTSYDKTARLWNAGSGQPIGPKLQHEGPVNRAVFSPDGTRILTASVNKTARFWDASSGQPIGLEVQQEGLVDSAVFSPDGTRILTTSADHAARLWDAPHAKDAVPPIISELIEIMAGYRISPNGLLEAVPLTERRPEALLQELSKSNAEVVWKRLFEWYFTPPTKRTISLYSSMTVDEFVLERIAVGSKEATLEAWRAHFGHPLIQLALARFETNEVTRKFLIDYGLKHLPNDPALRTRAAELQKEAATAFRKKN